MNRLFGPRSNGIDVSSSSSSSISTGDGEAHQVSPKARQLKKIDAALRRLEAGRFGHCLYCGDQIPIRRLHHDPAVESCAVCDED